MRLLTNAIIIKLYKKFNIFRSIENEETLAIEVLSKLKKKITAHFQTYRFTIRIMLTISVVSEVAEKSFSKFKIIKNILKVFYYNLNLLI